MAGIAWGDAAGAMVDERRAQRKEAVDLESALAERAYRQALIQQAQAQDERLRQQMGFEREQFDFQKQQLGQKASDERNQQGLRMMAGDVADQYPNEPQKMVGTLIRAGIPVPSGLMVPPASAQAPEQFTLGPGQVRYDSTGKQVAAGIAPAASSPDAFTLSPGQVRYGADGKVIARGNPQQTASGSASGGRPASPADPASAKFLVDTADRTLSAIDGVLPDINGWTAGYVGSALSNIPGTPAANVSAELASVAGNIAFNALQQMRAASRTGGALGQVTERELDLLSSVEGSIRQNQSPANLRQQLEKVRESMQRIRDAAAGGSGSTQAAPTVENWVRDPKTGKLSRGK